MFYSPRGGGTLKEWIEKMGTDTFDQLWDMACKQMGNCGSRNPQLEKPYELGGVRLTREEAMYSFVKTAGAHSINFNSMFVQDYALKATFPMTKVRAVGSTWVNAFGTCINLESVILCQSYVIAGDMSGIFGGCSKLRFVKGTIDTFTNLEGGFRGCTALEEVEIKGAKDVSFSDSPRLSITSLEYLVKNAYNTGPITVTVHADVYAKLTGGEGSEQRWQQVFNDAQAKQIAFVSA